MHTFKCVNLQILLQIEKYVKINSEKIYLIYLINKTVKWIEKCNKNFLNFILVLFLVHKKSHCLPILYLASVGECASCGGDELVSTVGKCWRHWGTCWAAVVGGRGSVLVNWSRALAGIEVAAGFGACTSLRAAGCRPTGLIGGTLYAPTLHPLRHPALVNARTPGTDARCDLT